MAKVLSFGVVKPTPGTPAPLPAAAIAALKAGMSSLKLKTIPGTTGNVYILTSSAAADTTNYLNVYDVLVGPGDETSLNSQALGTNPIDVGTQLWIDVDTLGAGVLVAGVQA